MNQIQLIGRLTRDIELRQTAQARKTVGRFTLAVNRLRKEDGADFISCKVWDKRAETMAQYIKKGQRVAISGRLETGSYEKDGHKVYTTEVVVTDFEFIEPKKESQPDNDGFMAVDENSYDLPF